MVGYSSKRIYQVLAAAICLCAGAQFCRGDDRSPLDASVPAQHHPLAVPASELLHRVDRAVRMLKSELRFWEQQLRGLGPSSPFRYSDAFVWDLEVARLNVIRIKLQIEDLKEHRAALQRQR